MSEPAWVALGGQAVDYEGDWSAAVQYAPGDIVKRNGVEYIAVNPSLGQEPVPRMVSPALVVPLVTALPASPFDGQEVILTDSLTAPTYQWRLRYVLAKASNRWVFVGGSPLQAQDLDLATRVNTAYGDLGDTANSPQITIPVAGIYDIDLGAYIEMTANTGYMSYSIGAAAALDADGINLGTVDVAATYVSRRQRKTLAAVALICKYKASASTTITCGSRFIAATPVAVGG